MRENPNKSAHNVTSTSSKLRTTLNFMCGEQASSSRNNNNNDNEKGDGDDGDDDDDVVKVF